MGFRTHDEEGALDTMSFDEYLIDNKEATFVLSAKSDSMKDAGILRGDLVIVDRSKTPKANDIVLAVVDGSFVMRYLEDLPERDLAIEAVVTAVIRKYA